MYLLGAYHLSDTALFHVERRQNYCPGDYKFRSKTDMQTTNQFRM